MFNTGVMVTVDLNADLAEREILTPMDVAVLDVVTSANLACGFHAGNRSVMQATASACLARGVTIGAHVSYRDRQGFGRARMETAPLQLVGDILEQCELLCDVVSSLGGTVAYVKPHGALYNRMGTDTAVAASVVEALSRQGVGVLVAQAATAVIEPAHRAGLRVVLEGFPDRGYRPDGLLAGRDEPGALITDPAATGERAVSLATRGGITAVNGSWTAVAARTLCIHGDAPTAGETARAVRSALEAADVTIRAFVPTDPKDPLQPAGDRGEDR